MKIENAQVATYELEVIIEKPRKAVWKALTAETNTWWLPSFRLTGEGSIVTMRAEAGGQLIEKKEGGGSMVWFNVTDVTPLESLRLTGQKEFGGATFNMFKLDLEDHAKGTRLAVTDTHIGSIDEEKLKMIQHGWGELFSKGLKAHCERA